MLRTLCLLASVAAGITLLTLSFPGSALAEERRQVGPYELTIGWVVRPPYIVQPNGIGLRVMKRAEAAPGRPAPVAGLERTLQVEVEYAGQKRAFDLQADPQAPGHYISHLIPTRAGRYSFRVFGAIEGRPIDETFTSGENDLEDVSSLQGVGFPDSVETLGRLRELAEDVTLTVQRIPGVQKTAVDAKEDAQLAQRFGLIGMILGGIGVLLASVAIALATRHRW